MIASLSINDGRIKWRHQFQDNQLIFKIALSQNGVLSVTNDGWLAAWDVSDGFLLWDITLSKPGSNAVVSELFAIPNTKQALHVVVVIDGKLFSVTDGVIDFSWSPPESFEILSVTHSEKTTVVHITDGQTLRGVDISEKPKQGEPDNIIYTFKHSGRLSVLRTSDGQALVATANGGVLVIRHSKTPQLVRLHDIEGLSVPANVAARVDTTVPLTDSFVLVVEDALLSSKFIIHITSSQLKVLHRLVDHEETHSSVVAVSNTVIHSNFLATTRVTSEGTELFVVNGNAARSVIKGTKITQVFVQEFPKKQGSQGWRLLCVSNTGTVFALKSDLTVLWTSEQSLAHVVDLQMVTTPFRYVNFAASDDKVEFVQPTLLDNGRLFLDYLQASVHTVLASGGEMARLLAREVEERFGRVLIEGLGAVSATSSNDHTSGLTVLLTRGGHLFALALKNGQILWQRPWHVDAGVGASGREGRLFEVRKSGIHSARMAAVVGTQDATDLLWFDATTGHELGRQHLAFPPRDVFMLPITDSHHTHVLVVLDDQYQVHAFTADGPLSSGLPSFHHVLSPSPNSPTFVHGLIYHPKESAMRMTWNVAVGKDETVAAVFRRRKALRVASPVRVVGDRSILHKYLNPNLMAIATTKQGSEDSVSLYLIDSVSGHILYHSVHPKCSGPVNLIVSDNDVLMTVWNQQARHNELISMELFETREKDDIISIVLNTMSVPRDLHNHTHYSSFSRRAPEVISRQYILPKPVVTLGVTETTLGATAKQLLVGFSSNQILAIDRRFIDPRQSSSSTPTDEFSAPYNMRLPFVPLNVVTYNNTVTGLRFINTEPGEFESQSHMIAGGVDILFVPLTPSGTFDQLGDSFNRGLLVVAMVALTVVTIGLYFADRRKELFNKWR
eukprot:c6088_g1_i1.p1 GENE.c6088_g1_i1~~c6088_g1_i1.p1  ORF type:complete len:963 (-),score=239.72 c6088_g1_i1:23-2722(-)